MSNILCKDCKYWKRLSEGGPKSADTTGRCTSAERLSAEGLSASDALWTDARAGCPWGERFKVDD